MTCFVKYNNTAILPKTLKYLLGTSKHARTVKRVTVSGGSLWKNVILPLITYRNVKIFLTALIISSVLFLVFLLSTEGRSLFTDNVSTVMPFEKPKNKQFTAGHIATDTSNRHLHYGIVIDCGSSGSRVYVYFWPPHDGNPKELLNIQQMRDADSQLVVMKVEPGLSEFRDRPSEASEHLRPLLEYAATQIPAEKHSQTPLYIMATAGLRMLSLSDQEAILSDLRVDIALQFNFMFSETQVEVISGKQEGIYAWIGINYALHKFDHINTDDVMVEVVDDSSVGGAKHWRKRTVGMIDMGGGSVQIAFEVPKTSDVSRQQLVDFNLGCREKDSEHSYSVYVATFLGYGGNVARKRYEELLVSDSKAARNRAATGDVIAASRDSTTGDDDHRLGVLAGPDRIEQKPIDDPCLPVGLKQIVYVDNEPNELIGTGDFAACSILQRPLLNQSATCLREPCSLNGMHQPPIDYLNSEFFGFSEFYYSMEDVLRMAGKYEYDSFVRAAQDFCGRNWTMLETWFKQGYYPKANDKRFKMQCFKSAWIATVLHEGFLFPAHYSHFTSTQLIRGQDVQWTLGALVYKTRYFPLREIEKYSQHRTNTRHPGGAFPIEPTISFYLLVTCVMVAAIAVCVYLRRLRAVSLRRRGVGGSGAGVTDLSRVPTMSYFMVDDTQQSDGLLVERQHNYYTPLPPTTLSSYAAS